MHGVPPLLAWHKHSKSLLSYSAYRKDVPLHYKIYSMSIPYKISGVIKFFPTQLDAFRSP